LVLPPAKIHLNVKGSGQECPLYFQVQAGQDGLHSAIPKLMQDATKNLLLILVALFPIVDPLGGSPFFLALTRGYTPEARKALS
jgi:hypothetical protein